MNAEEILPPYESRDLAVMEDNEAARKYACYLGVMLRSLPKTVNAYEKLKGRLVQYAGIDPEIVDWHFGDVTPLIFEICKIAEHR